MSHRILRTAAFSLVMALALMATELSAASPLTPTASAASTSGFGPCQAGWQEWSVPRSALTTTPFEILTLRGKPAWILGGSNDGVLAMRRQGDAWKHLARGSSGHRGFVGGTALSKTTVVAVGYDRVPEMDFDPIFGRVAGGTLYTRKTPQPIADASALADIAVAPNGRAWAVGTRLYKGRLMAFAARWRGGRWTYHHPASSSGAGLLAVHRTPNGKIWAVGWKEHATGRARPLILKRKGGGWKTWSGPGIVGGSAVLTDIDFRSGRDGWAVGYQVGPGSDQHRAILFRWDGATWSNVALPWVDDFPALPRSISLGAGGEIWIGGTQLAVGGREARGFTAHRSAGAWTVSVVGVPDDVRSEITDIAATESGAVAVGEIQGTALVLRSCEVAGTASVQRRQRIVIGSMDERRAAGARHVEDDSAVTLSSTGSTDSLPPTVASTGFVIKDRTAKAGLSLWTATYGGFASDLDGNGRRDVIYSRHGKKPPFLALNRADGLKRITPAAFSRVDRHGCAAADVDQSGARDILCAVGRGRGKQIARHELSLDPSEPSARLARGGLGIADPLGRGRVVAFLKLDGDAYPEVFIGNVPTRDDSLPSLNRFYRNQGGTFVPAPEVGLDRAHGALCAWSGDLEKDGDQDLAYCTKWRTDSAPAGLRIMRNQSGKLRDRTRALGVKPMGDIDVAFGDVSGDGRLDLIQLSPNRVRVSKWTRDGYVRIWAAGVSDAVAVATGDVNGDGRADIYIARGTGKTQRPDRLLVSRNNGRRYTSVSIPRVSKGAADDVFTLDWDQNGLADFVVLNGRGPDGPVKLLASYRT